MAAVQRFRMLFSSDLSRMAPDELFQYPEDRLKDATHWRACKMVKETCFLSCDNIEWIWGIAEFAALSLGKQRF